MNGATVSRLDLDLIQSLFSHQNLQLLLRREESDDPSTTWLQSGDPADAYWPPTPPALQTRPTGTGPF